MLEAPPRVNVLGVGISVLSLESATCKIKAVAAQAGFSGYVTVTGVHGVVESQKDAQLKRIHNRSFLTTPDGMPMVWLGRWNNYEKMTRVYGPDLVMSVVEATAASSATHYFFGGDQGVADHLGKALAKTFPKLKISGTHTPPFRSLNEDEEKDLYDELQRLRPSFFWVGLSTPKQEKFMHDFLTKYPDLTKDWDHGLVMIGVGAAFDFHTGRIRQAPRWIRNSGFEWLFRVCMDPKRLWRRYAYSISYFLRHILPQMMGITKYPMPR